MTAPSMTAMDEARVHLQPLESGDAQAIGSLLRLMERARAARATFEAAQCAYECARADWFHMSQDKRLGRAALAAHQAATALEMAEAPLDYLLLAWEVVHGAMPFPGVADGPGGLVWSLQRLPGAEGVRVIAGTSPWVVERGGA